VLDTLNEIAPVVAVRGNNDKADWAHSIGRWWRLATYRYTCCTT
jgi:predicted phosphodiesterase